MSANDLAAVGWSILRTPRKMTDEEWQAFREATFGPRPGHRFPECPHRTCSTCANVDERHGECGADDRITGWLAWFQENVPEGAALCDITDAPTPCPAWLPRWERVARRLMAERG